MVNRRPSRTRGVRQFFHSGGPIFAHCSENCFLEYRLVIPVRARVTNRNDAMICEVVLLRSSQEILCVLLVDVSTSSEGAYSISSGYNSTHILLNPTLDFIEEFKASLPNDSLALTNNDSSQWSVGTATSVRARFFVLNERLTIREIIDSTLVGNFVTRGTIESIDAERGWQYLRQIPEQKSNANNQC
ncbi:hypothetical protein YC2023_097759 [Brassica napus]